MTRAFIAVRVPNPLEPRKVVTAPATPFVSVALATRTWMVPRPRWWWSWSAYGRVPPGRSGRWPPRSTTYPAPPARGARVAEGISSTPTMTATTTRIRPRPARGQSLRGTGGWSPPRCGCSDRRGRVSSVIVEGAVASGIVSYRPRRCSVGGGADAGRRVGRARGLFRRRRSRPGGGSTGWATCRGGCGCRRLLFGAGSTMIPRSRESAGPCRSMPSRGQACQCAGREARILLRAWSRHPVPPARCGPTWSGPSARPGSSVDGHAGVAQLEAQAICNRQVVGSTPTTGSSTWHETNGAGRRLSSRARATSKKATAPAAATLSDSIGRSEGWTPARCTGGG